MEQAADEILTEEALWQRVLDCQNQPFFTASGLPFRYYVKRGRHGDYTRELVVDRRENSKTLTWSSFRCAFEAAMAARTEPNTPAFFRRPKAIGDIRSISYIYPLLWRFGVIDVPEKSAACMRGEAAASAEKTE